MSHAEHDKRLSKCNNLTWMTKATQTWFRKMGDPHHQRLSQTLRQGLTYLRVHWCRPNRNQTRYPNFRSSHNHRANSASATLEVMGTAALLDAVGQQLETGAVLQEGTADVVLQQSEAVGASQQLPTTGGLQL